MFHVNPCDPSKPTTLSGRLRRVGAVFDVLTNRRRRYVLYCLRGQTEPVPVETVATRIAAWERGTDPAAVDERTVAAVYRSLYAVHLPALRADCLVSFQPASGLVQSRPLARPVDAVLAFAARLEGRTDGR